MTLRESLLAAAVAIADGTSNSLGALTVSNACTIAVGEGGSLSFASFTAGEELQPNAITIVAPLRGNVLRFGENAAALPSAQRAFFRWRDPADATAFYRVKVDEQGYVHPRMNGTVFFVK